ncbi:MAG: LD-carboxypeptidase, partial [Oscillospiraceae bacterium]|nr:LD-carboxypeptidase [Oscillospiraceae bacterium]
MVRGIALVSLSSGILGEAFVRHELEIGLKRLEGYGIKVKITDNALKGLNYLKAHPEKRAQDLLDAFADDSIDMILCAIGGDDTYRLLPYLFEDGKLERAAREKIFLGFSDTTINHLMLHKIGLKSFYGQAFLPDICELDFEMPPYTRHYFEELIFTGRISEIRPSELWYEERTSFDEAAIGTPLVSHINRGFELLQGSSRFSGEILGGCLDTLYDIFNGERHADSPALCQKYALFPSPEDWRGRILLLETSEERPSPQKFEKMLNVLKSTGVFEVVNGVLIGKPIDELYCEEYKEILVRIVDNPELPLL